MSGTWLKVCKANCLSLLQTLDRMVDARVALRLVLVVFGLVHLLIFAQVLVRLLLGIFARQAWLLGSDHHDFLSVTWMAAWAHFLASLRALKHLGTCLGVRQCTCGGGFLLPLCRGRVDGGCATSGWFLCQFVHGLFLKALADLLVCFYLLLKC